MAVYIFERITILKGGRGKYIDLMRRKWGPQNEAKHGVHMAGLWATAGQTADWPEANVLWEYRDWAHFAEASQNQYPREDKDPYLNELWRQALDWRSGGVSDLLEPSSFSPDRAEREARGLDAPIVQFERIKTKKGKMAEYHAAIASGHHSRRQRARRRAHGRLPPRHPSQRGRQPLVPEGLGPRSRRLGGRARRPSGHRMAPPRR